MFDTILFQKIWTLCLPDNLLKSKVAIQTAKKAIIVITTRISIKVNHKSLLTFKIFIQIFEK